MSEMLTGPKKIVDGLTEVFRGLTQMCEGMAEQIELLEFTFEDAEDEEMVNLFSEFLGSSYIDFVSVHYCRYNIIRTEFFLDEMIGFFIKLLCILITTVTLEVHRIHINHNLVKECSVFSQPTERHQPVGFHLLQLFHIGRSKRLFEMHIKRYAFLNDIHIFIGFIFALVVSFCLADIGSGVLFNPCTAHIRFVVFRHFRSPFSAGRSHYTTFFECV